MIIGLEIGVLIRIIANSIVIFCDCVVNQSVIDEIEKVLNTYKFDISEAEFYIPERFVKYISKEVNLTRIGNYPAFKNNEVTLGGYVYVLEED